MRKSVKKVDNKPMTLAEVLADSDLTPVGLHVAWLGHEGEGALVFFEPGTPDRPQGAGDLTDARICLALAESELGNGDPDDYRKGWTETHVVIRRHADNCREDLEDDEEECFCNGEDGFLWYTSRAEPDEPAALRVMEWRGW